MSFINKREQGKQGEALVIEYFEAIGCICKTNEQKFSLFDLTIYPYDLTVEVKNDLRAHKTGNIAIEIRNTKKNEPSGLYGTTADLWAHIVNDEIFLIEVIVLKNLIESTKPLRKIYSGGDNNSNILLYKKDFLKYFYSINNEKIQDIHEFLVETKRFV